MFLLLAWTSSPAESSADRTEGTEPGDCTNRADNDADGAFDCDDAGCAGSPDCEEETGLGQTDTEHTGPEDSDSGDTDPEDSDPEDSGETAEPGDWTV
jgi:hypothetical protein